MTTVNQEHFDKIAQTYQKIVQGQTQFQTLVARELESVIKDKDILDIGNGGFFGYDYKHAKRVSVLDVSPKMLETITDESISKTVGDARTMEGLPNNNYDVIIINQVLHHINTTSFAESSADLKRMFQKCSEKLKPHGEVVIIEPVLPQPLFWIEKQLFQAIRFLFGALGKGVIFFFSSDLIADHLRQTFSLSEPSIIKRLPIKGWLDPIQAVFPGFIKIPAYLFPTKFMVFRFKK